MKRGQPIATFVSHHFKVGRLVNRIALSAPSRVQARVCALGCSHMQASGDPFDRQRPDIQPAASLAWGGLSDLPDVVVNPYDDPCYALTPCRRCYEQWRKARPVLCSAASTNVVLKAYPFVSFRRLIEYFLRCFFSQARMVEVTKQGTVIQPSWFLAVDVLVSSESDQIRTVSHQQASH